MIADYRCFALMSFYGAYTFIMDADELNSFYFVYYGVRFNNVICAN